MVCRRLVTTFSVKERFIFRHAGIVVQCQPRKYFVKVGQQQYWIESDLIRPNTILDQVRKVDSK